MVRSLFGDDLTEYELSILVDSGIARSEWETISRQLSHQQRALDQRSLKNKIRTILKAAGAAVTVLPQLTKLTYQWTREGTLNGKRLRQMEEVPSNKKQKREESSLSKIPLSTQAMSDGNGSGLDAGLKETPIDEVGHVFRGPPNYTFVSLPYYHDRVVSATQWNSQWAWRMTSPYDVSVQASVVDLNIGAGTQNVQNIQTDASDLSPQKARWFDLYAGMYRYYHVISAKWHLTFENLSNEPLWVHSYYTNDLDRPAWASNQDMLMWPDTESHYVGTTATAVGATRIERNDMLDNTENDATANGVGTNTPNYETGNHVQSRGRGPILQLSGKYTPGDYNREIRLDSEVENWTTTNTNPSLPERHHFRVRPQWDAETASAGSNFIYDRPLFYRFTYRVEYLVEFKELVDGLRYPTREQPLTITVNSAIGSE
jgi:hypothetical protein